MKVGVIANPGKQGALLAFAQLRDALAAHGIKVVLDTESADFLGEKGGLPGPELAAQVDLVAVLGGDGTMLHAMAKLGGSDVPVAGINIGNLGFLTSCTDGEIPEFAKAVATGDFQTSGRTLLEATVERKNGPGRSFLALNEVVLARGHTGRLVSLMARVDGELLNRYRADGLIVATPTGSTAYSLSAGGPLISPEAGVFVITPICPHTLSQRSLVVDDEAEIELAPDGESGETMLFTVDGRDCEELGPLDHVRVRKSKSSFRLVRLGGRSFYAALRQKLNWRGG
jgi:NAD+ kinase